MALFEKLCKKVLFGNDKTSKSLIFDGDLNINFLDYEPNKKISIS